MKFIHLTDTHLVARGERLHGLDPVERLEACVASIVEHHDDAEFCMLTGDIADAGDPRAYAAAREALAGLPMRVHLIPGNHDDRNAFVTAFPDTARDAHGFVQHAFRHGTSYFLLLDTLEPAAGSAGAYCERRIEWLAERLAEAGGAPVYLFMHHPPFEIGVPTLDAIALTEPQPFADLLNESGNVRHIFFGHAHRPISGQWRGISFSTLYGTNHQTRLDLVSREYLAYTGEPPAYCVVLVDIDKVIVHTHHFLEDDRDIRDSDVLHR